MRWLSLEATKSVAYKEFLHIYRDRRVLLLVLLLPPLFTLLFGHAFETSELTAVPSLLINRDNTPRSQEFIDIISKNKTFRWRYGSPETKNESDLIAYGVRATLVIPQGWNASLENGDPETVAPLCRRQRYQYGRCCGRQRSTEPGRFPTETTRSND